MIKSADITVKQEIHRNTRWILWDAERASDKLKMLVVEYSQAEVGAVGLANIRKKFELFQKLHTAGISVLHAQSLLPNFNSSIAIVFAPKPGDIQKHFTFYTLASRLPITSLKEYLKVVLEILHIFWGIHKQGLVHNAITADGLIMKSEQGQREARVCLADVGELFTESPTNNAETSKEHKERSTIDYKYISPEFTGRTGHKIDQRSDIYSLGVLLYEVAVGQLPFASATSELELLHCHMTQSPPPLPVDQWGTTNTAASSVITNILHKMMNKSPSERYQSLYGVIRDIELILRAVQEGTALEPFCTAAFDLHNEFHLPNMKLYGRDREIATILKQVAMFQSQYNSEDPNNAAPAGPNGHIRYSDNATPPNNGTVVLVGGHSGIGKSSLIRNIFNTIYQEKHSLRTPVLLEGKHDRLKHTPYSAIIKALGGVIRRLLTLGSEELQWWKEGLTTALTPNGKVLVDVLPEAEAIIGAQPAVPALPPNETKTRFEMVLTSFMQVFLSKFTTILFLDDMQWADPSTLSLVESMTTNTSIKNMLLICAYRDNEVDSSHLFKIVMDDIQKKNVVVNQLILKPLQLEHTNQLIMDSFHCPQQISLPLAQLVQQKTSGNPFFLGQFLKTISQERYCTFNYDKHEWEWSLEQLKNAQYTDNVVDFMVAKIRKLPSEVQTAIQLASCLGNTFDLETLFIVSETPHEELERCIEIVIAAGLVVYHQETRVTDATNETVTVYKFMHDRVQEAFYVMLDVAHRMSTHLKIARLLGENKASADQASDLFFTIAHHYNEAADLVVKLPQDSKERNSMIDLNFEAAKRAKQSSATESACSYLQSAQRVLADDHFTSDYRRSFDIILLLADCQFNMRLSEEAEKNCALLLENGKSSHDKVCVYILLATYFESIGNLRKSIDIGFEALKLYDIEVPLHPPTELVEKMKDEVLALQKAKTSSILEIASLPPMPEHYLMLTEVLYTMLPTAYVMSNEAGLNLFYVLVCLGCKLSIEHGPAGLSGNIFAGFVAVLSYFEQYSESYQYAVMCYKLTEKVPHPASLARTETNYQVFGQWQQETMSQGKAVQLSGFRHAVEVGDVNYILFCATNGACAVLGSGEHLDDCEASMLQQLDTLRNLKRMNQDFVDTIFIASRAFKVLKGTTTELGKFDDDIDYNKFLARMNELGSGYFVCIAFFPLLFTSVIFEDYETALDVQNKTPTSAVNGLFLAYEQIVWRNLLYVAMLPNKDPELQVVFMEKVTTSMKTFEKIKNSPSLKCKLVLIEAELARISGDLAQAQELYDESIALAKDSNCLHVVGYAAEQAMKFYLGRHMERAATNYFRESRAAYFAWGAFAKSKQLESKYSFLMSNVSSTIVNRNAAISHLVPLDLQSVLKACQVLSSEINLTKLLAHMVRIVLQNTGAQKGFFVVPDNTGRLFIEAQGEAASEEVQSVHLDITDTSTTHPFGIVQYAYRTKLPVLLEDAFQDGMFTFEPYVQLNHTKSVLCIPVLGQAKVIGIMYVENNLMAGAFTAERLEVLQMLSTQMAISFENASLYNTLQMTNQMLEAKNHELLELDQVKDQFLANTSHELRTPLNGIIGLAEALIDDAADTLSVSTCETLALIVNSGRRLANLVNDILDLSALKAGMLPICPRPSSLKHALSEVLFLSLPLITSADLKLVDATNNLPHMVIDEPRILQVLQNIIGNAIKFTKKGTITISNDKSDEWVRIFITDTGRGIPEDLFETIFEDFKQVDGSLSRDVGGTGLGLSISRRIMELHGGTILVESKVGVGSKFTIKLPLALVVNDASAVPKKEAVGNWNTHHHKRAKEDTSKTVLLVDNDTTNQIVLKKLLNAYSIIHAKDGAEALNIINTKSTPPDFILFDAMLPTTDGLEVCERIQEKFPMCDSPIIQISARTKIENVAVSLKRGAKSGSQQELLGQLLVCSSCKMVCKNATSGPNDAFICEACKSSTKVRVAHRPSLDLGEKLINDPSNSMEVLHQLPFMITLYNLDGKPVLRNASAKAQFHTSHLHKSLNPQMFLPHISERVLAEEILQQVKTGRTVDRIINTDHRPITEYRKLWAKIVNLSLQGSQTAYILAMETETTQQHATAPQQTNPNPPFSQPTYPTSQHSMPISPTPSPHAIQSPLNTSAASFTVKPNIPPQHPSETPPKNVATEIKELTARLAMLKALHQLNRVHVKFRRQDSKLPFFHKVELELRSLEQLKCAMAKRLHTEPHLISAIVRDGDTLIEQDEDICDEMSLEVFV